MGDVCVSVTDQLSDGLTDVLTENEEVIYVSVCLQIWHNKSSINSINMDTIYNATQQC